MGLSCYGHCPVFLVAALLLDAAGLAFVLAGAVGRPNLDGSSLEEFLVLTGGLLLFLSLLLWLFWYSGNLPGLPAGELPLGAHPDAAPDAQPSQRQVSLLRLAAKLSKRLSQRRRPPTPVPSSSSRLPPDAKKSPRTAAVRAAAPASSSSSLFVSASPLELNALGQTACPHPEQRRATEERLV